MGKCDHGADYYEVATVVVYLMELSEEQKSLGYSLLQDLNYAFELGVSQEGTASGCQTP
jgi:hypothetical protein